MAHTDVNDGHLGVLLTPSRQLRSEMVQYEVAMQSVPKEIWIECSINAPEIGY